MGRSKFDIVLRFTYFPPVDDAIRELLEEGELLEEETIISEPPEDGSD